MGVQKINNNNNNNDNDNNNNNNNNDDDNKMTVPWFFYQGLFGVIAIQ
jgi:hypothetical protein